jgi:hypothetical protein
MHVMHVWGLGIAVATSASCWLNHVQFFRKNHIEKDMQLYCSQIPKRSETPTKPHRPGHTLPHTSGQFFLPGPVPGLKSTDCCSKD